MKVNIKHRRVIIFLFGFEMNRTNSLFQKIANIF